MNHGDFIKFLGTAGARFVVAKQLRSSAGTFLRLKEQNIILDPGPGTLVRCATSRPAIDVTQLNAIILTHGHIDHANDVNILIDAMTAGGLEKRGHLFAPRECLEGEKAVVLRYLRGFLESVTALEPEQAYRLADLSFSTSIRHRHPAETYGLQFRLDGFLLAFMVDTQYFPQLVDSYADADLLVMNVVRYKPHKNEEVMHLCLEDAKQILTQIKPRQAILTHFGMTMLKAKPWQVAKALTEELGIKVVAAADGMQVNLPWPWPLTLSKPDL